MWEPRRRTRGPVLLVHGWAGRGAQLGAFVAPLLERGHAVVAFDGPAHGRSPGWQTNPLDFAAAVQRVAEHVGPLDAVVAHSFGAVATTIALGGGLAAARVAYLGATSGADQAVRGFARILALPDAVVRDLRRRLEGRFGADIWQRISTVAIAPRLWGVPALVVHDTEDRDVPHAAAAALADAWPGAELVTTRGLGHRRILRDPEVIARVVSFLSDTRPSPLAVAATGLEREVMS